MPCYMPLCQHIRLDGTCDALDHERNTIPGHTFYYCCIHRVYHCIQQKSYSHRRRLQQPLCGECAWLFFRIPGEAERRPADDIPAPAAAPDSPHGAGGSPGVLGRDAVERSGSDGGSLAVLETALGDIDRCASRGGTNPPSPATYAGCSRPPSRSAVSCRSSRRGSGSGGSPERGSVVVAVAGAATAPRKDREGDIVMEDDSSLSSGASSRSRSSSSSNSNSNRSSRASGSDAEPEPKHEPKPTPASASAPETDAPPGTVRVPIRDRKSSVLEFIPYGSSDDGSLDVVPLDFHAKFPEIFMFRYTDFAGRPAVQPTSTWDIMSWYLDPLVSPETETEKGKGKDTGPGPGPGPGAPSSEAGCDGHLLRARWWSCWAQGFRFLEPEVRWVLTLVFDLANVMIARQALGRYGSESPVFWRARYYLHELLGVVEDLAEVFDIPDLEVPRMEWFSVC